MQVTFGQWNMGECSIQRGHRSFSFVFLILSLRLLGTKALS